MRRIVYTCDRCGREIRTSEENPMAIAIDFAMREENDTSPRKPATEEIRNVMSEMLGRDYCYDCVEKIAKFAKYMMYLDGEHAEERADAMLKENERLCQEVGTLNDAKEDLMQQVSRMSEENEHLRGEVDELNGRIADMKLETLAEDAKKAADAAVSSNNKRKIGKPPKQAAEEPAAEAEKPEKPKREHQKREPDAGKIVALSVAGWSFDRIASDMHMDEDEVRNILQRVSREGR